MYIFQSNWVFFIEVLGCGERWGNALAPCIDQTIYLGYYCPFSFSVHFLMYSCVEVWSNKVWCYNPLKILFLFPHTICPSVFLSIYQSSNHILELSAAPTLPPYLCLYHAILLQHPQPSHPTAQPLTWTTSPHQREQASLLNYEL